MYTLLTHLYTKSGSCATRGGCSDNGDDSNQYDEPFLTACETGQLSEVTRLIELGATSDKNGIAIACENGHLPVVKFLMDYIIEKNSESTFYYWDGYDMARNCMFYACKGGNMAVIQHVIDYRKTIQDPEYNHFWDYGMFGATIGNHQDVLDMTIVNGAKYWDLGLYGAGLGGNIQIARQMIERFSADCLAGLIGICDSSNINMEFVYFILKYKIQIDPNNLIERLKSSNEQLEKKVRCLNIIIMESQLLIDQSGEPMVLSGETERIKLSKELIQLLNQ
jgi:hypothetical protein